MWFEKKVVIKLDPNQVQFPIEVLNLWDITELEIIGGNYTYFPEDISVLKNLKSLSVVSSKISSVPKELFELPNLTYLSLKNNCLTELPNLSKKTRLKTIILGRNKISTETIEVVLPFFTEVMTLDLSHNLLDTLPENFVQLINLQRFNGDSNKLKTIPSKLKDMNNLLHLSLENNLFSNEEKKRIEETLKIHLS